jgi:ABC-type transporter Mla subunit MlaD
MSSNLESRIKTVEEAMQALTQLAISASERADTHEQWINELAVEQVRLTRAQADLSEAQARTEIALAETNDRLNTLINVFERHLSEGRNGKA